MKKVADFIRVFIFLMVISWTVYVFSQKPYRSEIATVIDKHQETTITHDCKRVGEQYFCECRSETAYYVNTTNGTFEAYVSTYDALLENETYKFSLRYYVQYNPWSKPEHPIVLGVSKPLVPCNPLEHE